MGKLYCTDMIGRNLEEFIEDNRLVCINNGKGTRYNISNVETAIDLTITSNNIAGSVQ